MERETDRHSLQQSNEDSLGDKSAHLLSRFPPTSLSATTDPSHQQVNVNIEDLEIKKEADPIVSIPDETVNRNNDGSVPMERETGRPTLQQSNEDSLGDKSAHLLSRFPPTSLSATTDPSHQQVNVNIEDLEIKKEADPIVSLLHDTENKNETYLEYVEEPEEEHYGANDEEENGFLFDGAVKDAMEPSLTHQFRLNWCWPTYPINKTCITPENSYRNVGPSSIIEVRSDPHIDHRKRRVALIISCGRRFLLPLIPESRENSIVRETGVFWRIPSRLYEKMQPQFAELVVGTLDEIERISNSINNFSSVFNQNDENKNDINVDYVPPKVENILYNIGTFFFQSLPYRTLWLYQFRESIIVSLPCEERLVSLSLKNKNEKNCFSPEISVKSINCIKSFRFPQNIVPLDISEVYDRPFLAVGTVSHGVLILLLEKNGTCKSIIHHLPLSGLSTSIFPVVHISTVFPPLFNKKKKKNNNNKLNIWGVKSSLISQCLDGAILCASPYENRTIVVKCSSAGSDGCGFESQPPTRPLSGFISSTPYCIPSIGPILATLDGKVMYFSTDGILKAELNDELEGALSSERRQQYGSFDAVYPNVNYYTTTKRNPGVTYNHFCEGGPVIQKVSHSRYKATFIRNWICMSTLNMEIVLIDRKVSNYVTHSNISLNVPPSLREDKFSLSTTLNKVDSKNNVKKKKLLVKNETETQTVEEPSYPVALEDGISGLSWIKVNDGFLQLVAAHHKNWLSVVTWKA